MNRFDKAQLKCPICGAKAELDKKNEKTIFCNGEKKHSYDLSASGYVNLASPKQCGGGDTKSAVRARTAFLDGEYYLPIANTLTELLNENLQKGSTVVDAGCGEGYYTLKIAQNSYFTMGFDISKFAVEAGAKRAKREGVDNALFAVASVYELPIFDAAADAVVNIFAPCVEEEYSRALKDGGLLVVVQAGKKHLLGLKNAIYDNIHENDTRADLPKSLSLICEKELLYEITVFGNENIKNLFEMTPYYWRTSQDDAKKLETIDRLTTEIDILFSVYKKN